MGTGRLAAADAADARFAAAHRRLLADPDIQFALPPAPPKPKPPEWLHQLGEWIAWAFRPIGRLIAWIGRQMPDAPYARILLWAAIACALGAGLYYVVAHVRGVRIRPPWRRRAPLEEPAAEGWQPDAAPARALLREADALATQGRFAEAIHLLLQRSIEDIDRRRPQLVRPADTSRDIAGAAALPSGARQAFAPLVRAVERSLFGGRAVDAGDWQECRGAYAEFALAKAWA